MRLPAALAALALLVVSNPAPAANAQAAPASALAAHKAAYTLTLDSVRGNDIVAAHGTMGYEVVDACDGWAVRQRLEMVITNSDGQDIEMVSDYTTWESKDGLKLRFRMKQTTETAVSSQTEGAATLRRPGAAGEARYVLPRQHTITLPAGTQFPMQHTASIIAGAREGKRFLNIPLFDGTDENGVEDSSVVVLDWKKGAKTTFPALQNLQSTRVRIAFFDRKPDATTPAYEVGMRYWENGVADDMQMDFGDFVMRAKMTNLAMQPKRC